MEAYEKKNTELCVIYRLALVDITSRAIETNFPERPRSRWMPDLDMESDDPKSIAAWLAIDQEHWIFLPCIKAMAECRSCRLLPWTCALKLGHVDGKLLE